VGDGSPGIRRVCVESPRPAAGRRDAAVKTTCPTLAARLERRTRRGMRCAGSRTGMRAPCLR